MRKLVVANDFLAEAAEVLRQGKRVKVRIDGQSMFPFIIGGKEAKQRKLGGKILHFSKGCRPRQNRQSGRVRR